MSTPCSGARDLPRRAPQLQARANSNLKAGPGSRQAEGQRTSVPSHDCPVSPASCLYHPQPGLRQAGRPPPRQRVRPEPIPTQARASATGATSTGQQNVTVEQRNSFLKMLCDEHSQPDVQAQLWKLWTDWLARHHHSVGGWLWRVLQVRSRLLTSACGYSRRCRFCQAPGQATAFNAIVQTMESFYT